MSRLREISRFVGGTPATSALTTTKSAVSSGQDGWVFFDHIPYGTYGLMAYKDGFDGYLKQFDCNGNQKINSTIKNNNTEGQTAAWNNTVPISAGSITYCYDVGLIAKPSSVALRVQEFDQTGWTGKFVNDATVKLTDAAGTVISQTASSTSRI